MADINLNSGKSTRSLRVDLTPQECYLNRAPFLRDAIIGKQQRLGSRRDSLTVIIRPKPGADYHELVGVLDEMTINGVKKYMIAD